MGRDYGLTLLSVTLARPDEADKARTDHDRPETPPTNNLHGRDMPLERLDPEILIDRVGYCHLEPS